MNEHKKKQKQAKAVVYLVEQLSVEQVEGNIELINGQSADVFDGIVGLIDVVKEDISDDKFQKSAEDLVDKLLEYYNFDQMEKIIKCIHGYLPVDLWEHYGNRKKAISQDYTI